MNVKNTRGRLVTAIQGCYKEVEGPTRLDQIKHEMSRPNFLQVLEDTETWTEEIWWRDAREVDQSDKGEKTPMVVDSPAGAAAAGSANNWATSSTAASVAVVGAAVSPDNIAGVSPDNIADLFVSVPVMAASSLPFSGEAPRDGDESKSLILRNQRAKNSLISFSLPNALSENPLDLTVHDSASILRKQAEFHAKVQHSLIQNFANSGYNYQVY